MVAIGMNSAINPKVTPSPPRSAISHQLRASAAPRLSGGLTEAPEPRCGSYVVLVLMRNPLELLRRC
jgi:hypothetical protein